MSLLVYSKPTCSTVLWNALLLKKDTVEFGIDID